MKAQKLYKQWKDSHKINMAVYTDEQMFVMGYNARQSEFDGLIDLIVELESKIKELSEKTTKKKVKKDD